MIILGENRHERTKTRAVRKKTVVTKAHELVSKCGGQLFILHVDEMGERWVYCSSEEWREEYNTRIKARGKDHIMTPQSKQLTHPTPSKQSSGDCNFVVTQTDDPIEIEVVTQEEDDLAMEGTEVIATGMPGDMAYEQPTVSEERIPEFKMSDPDHVRKMK